MDRADKRHKITQLYRRASMLLCVRNRAVLLWSNVERSTEHILHVPLAATSLKNIFISNKYKLKSNKALTLFWNPLCQCHRRQDFLIFLFNTTKQIVSHFICFIHKGIVSVE